MKLIEQKIGLIGKSLLAVGVAFGLMTGSAKAGQQDDQIAYQLGALIFGVDLSDSTIADALTAEQRAYMLVQGRAALKANAKKPGVYINYAKAQEMFPGNDVVNPIAWAPFSRNYTLRDFLWKATQNALSNPQILPLAWANIPLSNGKLAKGKATLDSRKTTASAIFIYVMKRIPNMSPDLVYQSINSIFAKDGSNFNTNFKYKDENARMADAVKIASKAMAAGLKGYAKGTVNWAPPVGYNPATDQYNYLPNFTAKPIGTQPASPKGIADAAAGIAGNAVAALYNTYGATPTVVLKKGNPFAQMAAALVKGAAKFQKTSTKNVSDLGYKNSGAVGGTGFGLIATAAFQAGTNAIPAEWGSADPAWGEIRTILEAITVAGTKAAGANGYFFAYGVAQGFTAAYLLNGDSSKDLTDPNDIDAFITANVDFLLKNFFQAGTKFAVKDNAKKFGVTLATYLEDAMRAVINAYNDADGAQWQKIAGALGLNMGKLPVGYAPVTDTLGL